MESKTVEKSAVETNIVQQHSYFKHFCSASNRLASYKNWPKHHHPEPEDLTRAGFIYSGCGDYCWCFNCKLGIKNWNRNDSPSKVHKKYSADCSYIKLCYA